MLAHDHDLVGVELAGLEQDAVGRGNFADVVQEGAACDDAKLFRVDAHLAGERNGVGGDAAGVTLGLGVAQIERIAHRLEGKVVTLLQVVHGGAQSAGAGGDDLLQVLQVGGILFVQAAVLQHASDSVEELGALERLQQIVGGTAAEGAGGNVDVMHGGQHDYGQAGMVAADYVQQAQSVGAWHHHVREHQFAAGIVQQMQQGLFGTSCRTDVVAAALQ